MPNHKFRISEQAQRLIEHLGDAVDMDELQEYAETQLVISGNLVHAYLIDKVEGNFKPQK